MENIETKKTKKSLYSAIRKIIIIIFIILLLLLIVFRLCFSVSNVVGDSMYPTLKSGQAGYTDLVFYKLTGLKRFDIIVIDRNDGTYYVKRIVGMPNEKINYKDGKLYINDKYVEEKFISEEVRNTTCLGTNFDSDLCVEGVKLGKKDYYVLGDNRSNSQDSRIIGVIKYDDIVGRGFVLFGTCTNESCSKIKRCKIKVIK